jgi:hypothetical protein
MDPEGIGVEPEEGFARFLFKVRHGGPAWIWRRISSEFVLPTTKPGKVVHASVQRMLTTSFFPLRVFRRTFLDATPIASNTLYAFYDLKVEPITFDFLWFLAGADLARRVNGLMRVHVVIVPGPEDGVREEDPAYEAVVDRDARRWRILNILVNSTALLPTCSGFTLAGSRKEAAGILSAAGGMHYPSSYESIMPSAHHPNDCLIPSRTGVRPIGVLRATPQGLRYVDQFIANFSEGRRLITITIRDYAYGGDRNSMLSAWSTFAKGLNPAVWWPVFVLDTERTLDPIPAVIAGFRMLPEASWNVSLRMALYQRAWLNLGVNNGPMALSWLNDQSRYLTFKMATPTVSQTTVAFNRSRGFEPDESLPFATVFQRWVWEDDTVDVIQREFQEMVGRIEGTETKA